MRISLTCSVFVSIYIVFHFSRMIPCRRLELLALVLFVSYLSFSFVLLRNNMYTLLFLFRFLIPCAYSVLLILFYSCIFSLVLRLKGILLHVLSHSSLCSWLRHNHTNLSLYEFPVLSVSRK